MPSHSDRAGAGPAPTPEPAAAAAGRGEGFFGSSVERLQGSPNLQMPKELETAMTEHLEKLRDEYIAMNWAKRSGWGSKPAVVVRNAHPAPRPLPAR